MEIKTKYSIGDRVWIVYESSYRNEQTRQFEFTGEVAIYDTEITSIAIDSDGLYYCCSDGNYSELKEDDVILYEDEVKLMKTMKKLMQEIHKRESEREVK